MKWNVEANDLGSAHQQRALLNLNIPIRPRITVIELPFLFDASCVIRAPAFPSVRFPLFKAKRQHGCKAGPRIKAIPDQDGSV